MTGFRTVTGILGAVGAAALALPNGAYAAGSSAGDGDLGSYRFRYRVSGSGESSPLQVFDDGRQTYFQFPTADSVPRIVALDDSGGRVVPPAEVRPPFVVVASVSSRFEVSPSDRAASRESSVPVVVEAAGEGRVALAAPTSASPVRGGQAPVARRTAESPDSDLLDQARELYRRAVAQRDAEAERLVLAAIRLLDRTSRERPAPGEGAASPSARGSAEHRPKDLAHVVIPGGITPPAVVASVVAPSLVSDAPTGRLRAGGDRPAQPSSTQPSDARYPSVATVATGATAIGSPHFGLAGHLPAISGARDRAGGAPEEFPSRTRSIPPEADAHADQRVADVRERVRVGAGGVDTEASRPPVQSVPSLLFQGAPGQRVSEALQTFLANNGWAMEWESESDFTIRRAYQVRGTTVEDVLVGVLGDYQLSAVVYRGNRVVAVATAEPGRR